MLLMFDNMADDVVFFLDRFRPPALKKVFHELYLY